MSGHAAVDVARFYTYVSPSAREHTLCQEAAAFTRHVSEVGFWIPPRLYRVAWYVEDWWVRLPDGEVPFSDRRPVRVYLKAGRLASARTEAERRLAERGLLSTCFHELAHVRHVLTWPLPIDLDKSEQKAEEFAERALEALAEHEARCQQLINTACTRR